MSPTGETIERSDRMPKVRMQRHPRRRLSRAIRPQVSRLALRRLRKAMEQRAERPAARFRDRRLRRHEMSSLQIKKNKSDFNARAAQVSPV